MALTPPCDMFNTPLTSSPEPREGMKVTTSSSRLRDDPVHSDCSASPSAQTRSSDGKSFSASENTNPIESMNKHEEEQPYRSPPSSQSPSPPMFDFPKILPKTQKNKANHPDDKHKRPRALNESMSTCPLTISNFSADGAPSGFSVGSGSTSSGSNLSAAHHHNATVAHRGRSVVRDGVDPGGDPHGLVRPDRDVGAPGGEANDRQASWPAESPDPLSFTARWALRASPPGSPTAAGSPSTGPSESHHHYHHDTGHMATLGEVAAQDFDGGGTGSGSRFLLDPLEHRPVDVKPPQQQQQQQRPPELSLAGRQPSRNSSDSGSSGMYLPVRHHHNHLSKLAPPSALSESSHLETEEKDTGRRLTSYNNGDQTPRGSLSSSSHSYNCPRAVAPSSPSDQKMRPRRSSFSTPINPLRATIVFVDLEGYSKSSDVHQRRLTCDFMNSVRNLLTFAYGRLPVRGDIDDYVILPTGDGAAVIVIRPPRIEIGEEGCEGGGDGCGCVDECRPGISKDEHNENQQQLQRGVVCHHCQSSSLRTTEETALWIGASLLLWASRRHIGLRVGLNSGELSIVEDPYGDPNVCGDAINMAARIMDTALPGQILASASSVVPELNLLRAEEMAAGADLIGAYERDELDGPHHAISAKRQGRNGECARCPTIQYEIAREASEVVVKHGVTTNVQSITCALHPLPRPEDLPPELRPPGGGSAHPPSHAALTRRATDSSGESHSHPSPHANPLMRSSMRKNPLKQSFASLSSLQPQNSSSSLRGALSRKRGSGTDKSGPVRNSSWKLVGDSPGPSEREQAALTRMSMLSQLSNEEMSSSSKTLNASNSTAMQQQPAQAAIEVAPQHVGNHRTPATKWYMKIKPTEMQSSRDNQIKPKVLPQELIRRHKKIAFLGIMHDNLSKGFIKILENDPSHRWDQVYVLFPSDSCLKHHLAKNYRDRPVEELVRSKRECRATLERLMSPVVRDLRFLQYDHLMHCGSYWDWKDPGGFIHVSPLTWGANPKTCPAMNYYWNSRVPSPEYRVYREGLEYLLGTATPFAEDNGGGRMAIDGPPVCERIGEEGPTQ